MTSATGPGFFCGICGEPIEPQLLSGSPRHQYQAVHDPVRGSVHIVCLNGLNARQPW